MTLPRGTIRDASDYLHRVYRCGLRNRAWRLTAPEADKLESMTGQRAFLLGLPVTIKEGKPR